jgi:precorrin-6B methylase 2
LNRLFTIICLLACCTAEAQSIVTSGSRNSIIVSGVESTPLPAKVEKTAETAPQKATEPEKPAILPTVAAQVISSPTVQSPAHTDDYLVYFYQNNCGGCIVVDRSGVLDRLQASGVPLTKVNMSYDPQWRQQKPGLPVVGPAPTFWVVDGVTKRPKKVYEGYQPYETLMSHFGRSRPSVSPAVISSPLVIPPAQNVVYSQPVQRPQPTVVNYPGYGRIDLRTYGGCGNRNCQMCQQLLGMKANLSRYQPMSLPTVPIGLPADDLPADQQPTPYDVVDQIAQQLQLTPSDVLADLGCGDARILIAAVKRYGCSGVGIEIDPKRAEQARQLVEKNGLSSRIEILTGDALQFDPEEYKVTAITAYLYPDLLERLKDKMQSAKVIVCPFHQIPGMEMTKVGDVWVARR